MKSTLPKAYAWCIATKFIKRPTRILGGYLAGRLRTKWANIHTDDLVGYSREDLLAGRLVWPDLTPREYVALDEFAHEEGYASELPRPSKKN